MVYRHGFQASRYELKYLIDEQRAAGIRDFLRSYLVVDEYARPEQGNSYPVYSLYLDSPSLTLYWSTAHGLKNRFKLRIRFYDDQWQNPAFLEIKRRVSDVICKERAPVTREAALGLLKGRWPSKSCLIGGNVNGKPAAALQNFCRDCHAINARGCIYVFYVREAYVSADSDQVRVTFDRQLCGSRYRPGDPLMPPYEGTPVDFGGVILELKFTDRFPDWMRHVVGAFDLWRVPCAKYIACLEKIGAPWPWVNDRELGIA